MKKGERKATILIQRHVRGWRVRTEWPLAQWRRQRQLRKALVSPEVLLSIDNLLKAYVLQDAGGRFFFPAEYDANERRAVLERAEQLGFDCGEEARNSHNTGMVSRLVYVQRPPTQAEASGAAPPSTVDAPTGSSSSSSAHSPSSSSSSVAAAEAAPRSKAASPELVSDGCDFRAQVFGEFC